MTAEKSPYGKVDLVWVVLLTVVGSILSVILATSVFDLSVFLSGLLCVGLIAIGRRAGYLVGLYNSLSYSLLAYGNGLFGEVYLNLLFFVPTGIVGYVLWQRHSTPGKAVVTRQLDGLQRAFIAAVCIVATVGLGLVLRLNPNQNTPFVDATTNVLSVVATFLMMWSLFLLNALFGYWRWHVGTKGPAVLNARRKSGEATCDAA